MDIGQEQPSLRVIKYLHNGQPYTAFVALNLEEFSDVIETGTGNLSLYQKKIVSVVEGHDPTELERRAAYEAFVRVHTNSRGPAAEGN